MKTNKLINCPQCGGFGFTSTPVSTDYEITVCRAKTCELCQGAGVIEVPTTNADRIRAMSDEELAKLLLDGCRGSKCDDQPQNEWGSVNCFQCRMNWLQQPAEDDDKQ